MFGYVTPDKGEMKVREYECYRAVYCGLCMQLKADYGFVSRMLLNYDLVTVALLADGISGEKGSPCMKRCMANPLRRRCMHAGTQGLRLAAASLVLLSWYKLADDLEDEPFARRFASGTLRFLLCRAHKKAAAAQPELDRLLAEQTVCQQTLEQAGCANPDEAAEPTGRMTAAILEKCAVRPEDAHILSRMGLFLGKILYWLDAAEDYDKDKEKAATTCSCAWGWTGPPPSSRPLFSAGWRQGRWPAATICCGWSSTAPFWTTSSSWACLRASAAPGSRKNMKNTQRRCDAGAERKRTWTHIRCWACGAARARTK